eukprot:10569101-Lingulodinium_polyedra.AAC.1
MAAAWASATRADSGWAPPPAGAGVGPNSSSNDAANMRISRCRATRGSPGSPADANVVPTASVPPPAEAS